MNFSLGVFISLSWMCLLYIVFRTPSSIILSFFIMRFDTLKILTSSSFSDHINPSVFFYRLVSIFGKKIMSDVIFVRHVLLKDVTLEVGNYFSVIRNVRYVKISNRSSIFQRYVRARMLKESRCKRAIKSNCAHKYIRHVKDIRI